MPQLAPSTLVAVQRLAANGSDAITGITWDGWSYNYELANGQPVRLANVTDVGETVVVSDNGTVAVTVPDASAAVLWFVGNGSVPEGGGDGTMPPIVSVAVRETMTSAGLRAAVGVVGAFWAVMMGILLL